MQFRMRMGICTYSYAKWCAMPHIAALPNHTVCYIPAPYFEGPLTLFADALRSRFTLLICTDIFLSFKWVPVRRPRTIQRDA
jgi:hypothetical protein